MLKRLSVKYKIVLLVTILTCISAGINFYIIMTYQPPLKNYEKLISKTTTANNILLTARRVVDADFYTTLSNLHDEKKKTEFFNTIQTIKRDIEILNSRTYEENENINLHTISRMVETFIAQCNRALDTTVDMKAKLASYEKANTIYYLLTKNLGEFINLQIGNADEMANSIKVTTQRMWILSIIITLALLVFCLLFGFIYAHRIGLKIYEEISDRMKSEAHAKYLANHDQLTKLPNRHQLEIVFSQMASGSANQKIALLFIDLDGFKDINDSYGHSYGDEVLKCIAGRIVKCIRNRDVAGRLGGDEFTIIIADASKKIASEICHRLIKTIEKPIICDKKSMTVTASIGICIYPDSADQYKTLMALADQAMYEAKKKGKNQFIFFEDC